MNNKGKEWKVYEEKEKIYKKAIANFNDLWLKCKYPDYQGDMIVACHAMELQRPKAIEDDKWCPTCGSEVSEDDNFCHMCGQCLRW